MRIKISGKWEIEPLINEITKALTSLSKNYPIKNASGINLYLNTYSDDGKRFEVTNEDGDQLTFIIEKQKELKKPKLKVIQGGK